MLVHRRTYPLWRRQPDDRGRNAGLPHCPNATFGPGSELISWVSSRVLVHYAPYQSTSALPRTSPQDPKSGVESFRNKLSDHFQVAGVTRGSCRMGPEPKKR